MNTSETKSSPSQTLLSELCNRLNLDSHIRLTAENYLYDYKQKDDSWDEVKSKCIVRCVILAASRNSRSETRPLSISALLRDPSGPDLHTFILKLKEFSRLSLEDNVNAELQRIINNFAFSLTLFNKYEEVWDKVRLEGPEEDVRKIKDMGWLVFSLAKINLLQRRNEIVECACMLLGTFHFIVMNRGDSVQCAVERDSDKVLRFLSEILKAHPEQVNVSATHLALMIEQFKKHDVLRGTQPNSSSVQGILDSPHLSYNLQSLNQHYIQKLLPDDIDETHFIFKQTKISTPLKPHVNYIKSTHRFSSQRVLNYEDDENLSIHSKLHEIKFPNQVSNSPYSIKTFPPPTPMTTAMEMDSWLNSQTDSQPMELPELVMEKLPASELEMVKRIIVEFKKEFEVLFEKYEIGKVQTSSFLRENFNIESIKQNEINSKVELTFKLFYKVLSGLISNEEKQQELRSEARDLSIVLKNENFYKAILACCLETLLFIHNITALEFEEVLDLCKVTAFDAWKLMKNFIDFDPKIPTPLRQYFKNLELRVITSLAWNDSSPIPHLIKQHLSNNEDISHPALLMFCRRVLSHSAIRIMELSQMLGLDESIREEIWSVMKNALSEETELFINRHMDQIVISTIYGVCRAKNLNVTFNSLITKYTEFYSDSGKLFRQVRIDDMNTTGDIIQFYNEVFVRHMKNYLLALSRSTAPPVSKPRLPAFNPSSPLPLSLPQPMISYSPSPSPLPVRSPLRSPFMTPRTRRLYAFGESPSANLDSINRMMQRNDKLFDEEDLGNPTKRPKHIEKIFNEGEIDECLPDDFADFKD